MPEHFTDLETEPRRPDWLAGLGRIRTALRRFRTDVLATGEDERWRTVPAMRSPRASNCSVMMRPKPLLTPVMSRFLWGIDWVSVDSEGWSEAFAGELLAPCPERLGVPRVYGVGPYAGAHRADQPLGDL